MLLTNMKPEQIIEAFELFSFCIECDKQASGIYQKGFDEIKFKRGINILNTIIKDNTDYNDYIRFFVVPEYYDKAVQLVELYHKK